MNVLVINCGSSSLKFQVIDTATETLLAKGLCERIGIDGALTYQPISGGKMQHEISMPTHSEAIRAVLEYYGESPENLVVICDDVYLDVGVIRIRPKGSAGGHNGLKNIILHLKTEDFKRIRIGVGKQPEGMDLIRFVLSNFTAGEKKLLQNVYEDAACAAVSIFTDGTEKTMNQYNGKRV